MGAMGVLLIILKLAAVIDWSWWIVLLPFYFAFGVWLAIIAGTVFVAAVVAGFAFGVKWIVDHYNAWKDKHRIKSNR